MPIWAYFVGILVTPLAYFYFNRQYFLLIGAIIEAPFTRIGLMTVAFFCNYTWFLFCTLCELPLILNWVVFFLLLLAETASYIGEVGQRALFCTMTGILCGLAVNIFCRCVIAVVLDQPLVNFDNHVTSMGNLKGIPVTIGFLLAGAAMHALIRLRYISRIQSILRYPQHRAFLLELMLGLYVYLSLNLLLYRTYDNSLILKIWGIKSCVFVLAGFYLGTRYTLRICQLADYREQNRRMRRELSQKEREEKTLRLMVYRDLLTGLYNRQYAMERTSALLASDTPFSLCFADLDGLKRVNDVYGHPEGDRYLTTVARELERECRAGRDLLFRYGGDEFVVLYVGAGARQAEERIGQLNARLEEMARSGQTPYQMSLSFGVVESGAASDAEGLVREADARMYASKQKKKRARPNR